MPKDKIVFTVPEGFTLELLVDDADNPERQDPIWHTYRGGNTDVAKVTYKGKDAYVSSCGEMRLFDKVTEQEARESNELEAIGIFTDDDSSADRYEWENNSWYEAGIDDWQQFSEPDFDVAGGIASAVELLLEDEAANKA